MSTQQPTNEDKHATTEAMHALPEGSIIVDCYNCAWQKTRGEMWKSTHSTSDYSSDDMWRAAPLTLIDVGEGYKVAYDELVAHGYVPKLLLAPGVRESASAYIEGVAQAEADSVGTKDTSFAPDHTTPTVATWRRTPDEPQGTPRTKSATTVTARADTAQSYPAVTIHVDSVGTSSDIADRDNDHHSVYASTSLALTQEAARTLAAQLNAALHYQNK